jgi:hypothetical protein
MLAIPNVLQTLPAGNQLVALVDANFTAIAQTFVSSIAELRTVPKTGSGLAYAYGYYFQGDGGGGLYWYNAADTTSSDNGGTIIIANDGARWYLSLASNSHVSINQFGAQPSSIDNTIYIQNAFNSGYNIIIGVLGVYKVAGTLSLPVSLDFNLNGSTIQPTGNSNLFLQNGVVATATTTVSSGANIKSRVIGVSSAVGIAIGQRCAITSVNSPSEENINYPVYWGTVLGISGTSITLDKTLEITYLGTIAAYFWTSLDKSLLIHDGTIDGSQSTITATLLLGAVLMASNYELVKIKNLIVTGYKYTSTTIQLFTIEFCPKGYIEENVFSENTIVTELVTVRGAYIATVISNDIDGSGFGITTEFCTTSIMTDNNLIGRHKEEIDTAASPIRSVRGLKGFGNLKNIIGSNTASDYESGIRVEVATYFQIYDNHLINMGLGPDAGQVALNVSASVEPSRVCVGSITNNIIDGCGGLAIGVEDTSTTAIISDNKINDCHSYAIYHHGQNGIITENNITNWDNGNNGTPAIYCDENYAHYVDGNNFNNTVAGNTAPCLNIVSAQAIVGPNNISSSASNPLFAFSTSTQPLIATSFQTGSTTQLSPLGNSPDFSVANGKIFGFTMSSGAIEFSISDSGGSFAGKFFADNDSATIVIMADPSSHYQNSSTPAAGKVGVYKSATSSLINVINNTGGTVSFAVLVIGQPIATTDPH